VNTVKLLGLALIVQMTLHHARARGEEWKPGKAPLMTRWAKDVSPQNVLPEYPRPQMVRKEWMNLNGLWEFATIDQVKDPPIGKELPDRILVPFCVESALSGVMKHADRVWYRRTFEVPQDWSGKRVLLHFGAVDYESTIWVSGKQIGTHRGGYDAFTFDITDALKRDDPQELIVGVVDTTSDSQPRGKQSNKPEGIFYTPCTGIWQTVWLEPVPQAHVDQFIIMPDVDHERVTISTIGTLPSTNGPPRMPIAILDDGKEIARGEIWHPIRIPNPHLWSPEDPHLYTFHTVPPTGPFENYEPLEGYFGMRKIEVKNSRILLNGKPLMQVGPLDQGFWPDGIYTAPTDEALKYDLETIKKLGFNMLRKHVKVEPQRFYYWCDKLGILVWQDMPSAFDLKSPDARTQFEHELQAMVEQHRNSPSIICWVPFNEGWGQNGYDKSETKRIADWVKKLDPSRLVDNASGWTDSGAGDMHDIHAYPGPAAPKPEENRAIVLGEFGGLGLGVDGHTWSSRAWGYREMEDRAELTDRYVRLLGRLWQLREETGLDAGIYTQITDVETECNGLLTYDREVLKVDAEKVRAANLGNGPRFITRPLIASANDPGESPIWKYTFEKPADGWTRPDFDDSSWKTGPAGFGTEGTPGARVHTEWNAPDIWIRRKFNLKEVPPADVLLSVHHDEDAQIYINGVEAARLRRFTTEYVEHAMRDDARKSLHVGENSIAVHCHQTVGGQYIDVGLVQLVARAARP
jgi:glycosyl hydrolase family 2